MFKQQERGLRLFGDVPLGFSDPFLRFWYHFCVEFAVFAGNFIPRHVTLRDSIAYGLSRIFPHFDGVSCQYAEMPLSRGCTPLSERGIFAP